MSQDSSADRGVKRSNQTDTVSEQRDQANSHSSSDRPKVRDSWDYLELLLRPVSAFLTAITVALIGWFGQQALISQQKEETIRSKEALKEETIRNEMVQNYRLYTELLSKREEAESALRRDMFMAILEKFFKADTATQGETDMSQRLLKLEMLALNFSESLSLSPLFIGLDRDIDNFPYPPEISDIAPTKDRDRLHSLARRVADQQLSALSTGGKIWELTVPLESIAQEGTTEFYSWPDDDPDNEEGINDILLEGITRTYRFVFSRADRTYKSVHVFIEIRTENELMAIEREFDLNYFNFPMVDNTRLSVDQRFALILTEFGETNLKVTAICFPGKYSGQRDKPFLDDVIYRLQDNALKMEESPVLKDDQLQGRGQE